MKTLIITGGAGFIGCNFVRTALRNSNENIVILDKLTYAGSLLNIEECLKNSRVQFIQGDIGDRELVHRLFQEFQPKAIFNFAAETHVDRSIDGPAPFIETNIMGTFSLLEEVRHHYNTLSSSDKKLFRFLHVSTDEVFGSLGETGFFTETTAYSPNSPYSASKAAADHLVHAYFHTYSLPTLITNCSNNYGPFQFPEKLIPLMILNAIDGKPLPIYGDGGNVRDWIYVEDHCEGIWRVYSQGKLGDSYNIGSRSEKNNLQVVDAICEQLEILIPSQIGYKSLKKFVTDRPGHDRRYAINPLKMEEELGWKPSVNFNEGIRKTVQWYVDNKKWCTEIQKGKYDRSRLGIKV